MWAVFIIGALAAIAQLVSGGLSYKATKDTNEQNQQNYEDWKQYNTPANQMDRLQAAGLNPYMVNGVSNTLSQPFQVQNNQGLSSMFSQFSSALSQGITGLNSAERNEISGLNAETNRLKYKLGLENLKLRERMTRVAEKKGDAMTALLWSQGSIADLNAKFWQDMDDVRRNRYISDASFAASKADFFSDFYPLQLGYYRDFYPLAIEGQSAKNDYTRTASSQLLWSRQFQQWKAERMLDLAWANYNLRSAELPLKLDSYSSLIDYRRRVANLNRFKGLSGEASRWLSNIYNWSVKDPFDRVFRLFGR